MSDEQHFDGFFSENELARFWKDISLLQVSKIICHAEQWCPNDEARMSNDEGSPNDEAQKEVKRTLRFSSFELRY